ncbi:MAG: formylglycine-generating enzyme family protein [Deltaproteobacteria bacterium]|nr:formylglycine-generating enzyme family protein [Deltaproteobacteria bacterium]
MGSRGFVVLTVLLAGCLELPGHEGDSCTALGLCGGGLACVDGKCWDPRTLCEGRQCGAGGGGVDCGTCSGTTEVCQSNACVDVCAGKQCGDALGVNCGTCSGATEVCQSNACVDVCGAGSRCSTVSGVECGACAGGAACANTWCLPTGYVVIPAGTFTMGSPSGEPGRVSNETQHQVTLMRSFWLKATEVTQAEWRDVMGTNPSRFTTCGDACPVEQVSWNDAVDYVNALSRREGLPECYGGTVSARTFVGLSCTGYRLPTEAEWEYATRAGTPTALWNGALQGAGCSGGANVDAVAWYCGNASSTSHPVALKPANAWGLYDVHGNVWEWVHDWYGNYPGGAETDPTGPSAGSSRVVRGGSRGSGAEICRSAQRDYYDPTGRYGGIGFRPSRSIP